MIEHFSISIYVTLKPTCKKLCEYVNQSILHSFYLSLSLCNITSFITIMLISVGVMCQIRGLKVGCIFRSLHLIFLDVALKWST